MVGIKTTQTKAVAVVEPEAALVIAVVAVGGVTVATTAAAVATEKL